MNKTFLTGGATALALAVAVGGAAVAQAPSNPQKSGRQAEASVTRDDFINRRLARLEAMDANRDGVVTAEEMRAAAQARRAERAAARFDRLDADNDGVISRAEFEAGHAAAARGPRAGARGEGPRRPAMGAARRGGEGQARMGRGGERGPLVLADVRTRLGETFDRMDADRDGVLTAEERRAAASEQRRQGRERRMSRPAPASE